MAEYRPKLIVPPAEYPVTLEDFQRHARLDYDAGLPIAQQMLDEAVAYLDGISGVLGRCLITQTWRVGFPEWCDCLRLPLPDVQSVEVAYLDDDGVLQVVSDFELLEDTIGSYVRLKDAFSWPSLADDTSYPITADMVAGYGSPMDVPPDLKLAIKMLAAHWYNNREAAADVTLRSTPFGVDRIIAKYRRVF